MNKLKNWTIIVLSVFVLLSVWQLDKYFKKYHAEKVEKERIQNNYRVSKDSLNLIKGENGLLASRIEAQNLTIDEIKTYYKNIAADLRDMKIKLNKVSSITAFNTETTNNIHTFFKDSLRINDVPIEKLEHHDQWFDITIRKEGPEAKIKIVSRDSLVQVVHWQRSGRFWPTKFLTAKEYYQDIKSMNPDSEITFNQWIIPYKAKKKH